MLVANESLFMTSSVRSAGQNAWRNVPDLRRYISDDNLSILAASVSTIASQGV